MNHSTSNDKIFTSMIIEGFICPECQQDMSSIELLQTHFELFHLNKNPVSTNQYSSINSTNMSSNPNSETSLSSVFAKAKTLISSNENYDVNTNNSTSQLTNQHPNSNLAHNSNNSFSSNSNIKLSNKHIKDFFSLYQQDGHYKSHTLDFKKHRDNSIGRYVVQTNKLLITLDKLISIDLNVLATENDREIHFKSVVSWVNDKDVNLCPNCAKSFSLFNRKHHCRLCGAIMCNKCSEFISFSLAKQLTDPDTFIKTLSVNKDNQEQNDFKLRRADSITSLNSYFFKNSQSDTNQQSNNNSSFGFSKLSLGNSNNSSKSNPDQTFLRLCFDCGSTLEKKYKQLKDKTIRPQFCILYDELHSCISESKRLYPIFTKMAESLNIGESVHQLSYADEIRHNLIKLFQQIESISGRILKYGIAEQDEQDHQQQKQSSNDQIKLQRNVRFYAINYLKEHSFNLSSLPNKEEYEKLKAQRQFYLVEEMRRVEMEQLKQKKQINDQLAKRVQKQSSNDFKISAQLPAKISIDNSNGWIPSIKPNVFLEDSDAESTNDVNINDSLDQGGSNLEDDGSKSISSKKSGIASDQEKALRIQIQLVEGYLQDAIKHNKKDEAESLRKNLNELLNALVGTG